MVRLVIAAISYGTNDALLFWSFSGEIRQFGVVATYGLDALFNHPPVVGLWIELSRWMATLHPRPFGEYHSFTFIFKLPVIAGDGLATFLVWKIWRRKVGSERAAAIAAASACSLCGIVVSAYHCNTDCVYAALSLAAVYFMEERKSFLIGGLVLAAAINVKIVPVLLIPGLLLSCPSRREARPFLTGLALGVIPFLPALGSEAPSFVHNALAYNSSINNWGMTIFLSAGSLLHGQADAPHVVAVYHDLGRYLIFALIVGWAVVARRAGRWNRYEIAAVTYAIFLVFTPGFGIQYVAMIAPLLFASRPRIALVYSTAAGAFATALYISRRVLHSFPLSSDLERYALPESMLGLIAWGTLAWFLAATLLRGSEQVAEEAFTGQAPVASYTSARAA